MGLRRAIPAGLLDTGLASLTTFAIGLYSVRVLDPISLGAYALVFSAFTTLMEIPARLVFLPAEVDAAKRRAAERLSVLRRSLLRGAGVAIGSGLAVTAVVFVFPAEIDSQVAAAMVLTAVPCTMISPVQDHIRKMLHIGGRSWDAAGVSALQLVAALATVVTFVVLAVPVAWHPFGALTAANVVSSSFGLVRGWSVSRGSAAEPLPLGTLLRSGRWHLMGSFTPNFAAFGALSLVAHLAGTPAAGFAEAARILARPVAVLSQGIKAVIGPPLMRAGHIGDRESSRRLTWLYVGLVGGSGTLYMLVAGFEWAFNPLSRLAPNAYAVPGLAAMAIAVYVVDRVAGAGAGLQLLGAGRERMLAWVETVSGVGRLLGGATAPVTGPFAVPIGYLLMSLIRRPWLFLLLRRVYAEVPSRTPDGAIVPGEAGRASVDDWDIVDR